MDDDYYSIDAILADNQKIQCTFKLDVPNLGYLEGGEEKDIKTNSKIQLPHWLAPTLLYQDWVDFAIPPPFSLRVRKALNAEPRHVRLSSLVGGGGQWYSFGRMIVELLQEPQSEELAKVLQQTFHARLVDLMDQAQNFGGAAGSMGGAVGSGDVGDDFREGLEGVERELFTLAQDSARATKLWYESSDKK
ncbi:hypothetical protein BOTBODRAFT_151621 [Botryobasidium botryosum FD-172 SS1]|uniref:DNA replication complex GINS protein PSF3 n=1 Tax=Botryobasidium botryosum (strain FD-172 SS1) TaxID=930990 RepID=A0A067MYA9_BOTB1|nr:hypothetical protein BOTBODRAFT_151621 [Botryobasidium botryosum FD-172 SS1]